MTTEQMTRPADGAGERREELRCLQRALRDTAHRRKARAATLRAWSDEVRPALGRPLRRRAAELELAAVALELRADGLAGATAAWAAGEEEE